MAKTWICVLQNIQIYSVQKCSLNRIHFIWNNWNWSKNEEKWWQRSAVQTFELDISLFTICLPLFKPVVYHCFPFVYHSLPFVYHSLPFVYINKQGKANSCWKNCTTIWFFWNHVDEERWNCWINHLFTSKPGLFAFEFNHHVFLLLNISFWDAILIEQ